MLKIRQRGAFKPWGAAVSAVENRALGCCWPRRRLPVYKLLGGKVRDRVRVYNGGVRTTDDQLRAGGFRRIRARHEGGPARLHHRQAGHRLSSGMKRNMPGFHLGENRESPFHGALSAG